MIVQLEIIHWMVEKIGKCHLGRQLYLGQLIGKQSADSLMTEMIVNRLQMCSHRESLENHPVEKPNTLTSFKQITLISNGC